MERAMRVHQIEPTRETLHGHWSRDLAPALTIDPGDTVHVSTLEAMWCAERRPSKWPWERVGPYRKGLDDGHALTGPVAIRGAKPGQTLEVRIGEIIPDDWAWTFSSPDARRAAELGLAGKAAFGQFWEVDPARLVASDAKGRSVRLRPFMGVMGVAPVEEGIHSTTPPRVWGGNIDCKELVAGTTLYLPIGVEGALFSCGDGHGLQGDGEVCGTAIECPMTRVELTFDVIDRPLKAPRAKTGEGWLTFGFDADLDRASTMALSNMLDLIEELQVVDRSEALAIASLAVDLRITQVVNQTQGVHAVLRFDAIGDRG
jgi:acetamidase/formamidase